ncbi:MAG TPA: aminotransferase class IV [Candidatus Limnocylindrales bacterium]|nr:aminotransferase class IV [Candidatus Limnocylindrales bacterium]
MRREPICYLNGRYVPVSRARVSALDRGFLFGEGLFETWRTYRGRPYAIREHLARLSRTARVIGIPFDADADAFERRAIELARRNDMLERDGAIRLTITRGHGPVALVVQQTTEPTTLMLFRPLEPDLAQAKRDGVAIHLFRVGSGVSEGARQMKSINYLPAVIARTQARARGCFEAVYTVDDRTVLEGTTSNLFVVRRGVILTTPVSSGLLPGVTRQKVLRLAARLAKIREQVVTVDDLEHADEAFLTASTIEVVPVVRAGRRRIGGGRPGELTRALQVAYRRGVARRLGIELPDIGP